MLLTGVQAVCRVPLDVRRFDRRHQRRTRAFVSGYQGSPLGTLDFVMNPIRALLDEHGVDFRPGMNELLAATAVQGTQSVSALGSALDGVTGYWYGKAPGLDQALDAIRHGNLMGTSSTGGVVAFCGDDAAAKSSTVPGGSETVLRAALIPTLSPTDSADVLHLGMHGVAMSRASGLWVAVKVSTNVADGYGVVPLHATQFEPTMPLADGVPYRRAVTTKLAAASAVDAERNLLQVRLPLALEYARLNRLNNITARGERDTIGIIVAGELYGEMRQALSDMGMPDDGAISAAGIRLLKIGLVWPLDPDIVRDFARGLTEIVVIEEKGPHLESLVKDVLYNAAVRPVVVGQCDRDGRPLLPGFGGIDTDTISRAIGPVLLTHDDHAGVRSRLDALRPASRIALSLSVTARTPYFCSGCPHNSSTKVPEGALVSNGIGCHTMSMFMDEEQSGTVTGLTQMGGEGAQWIGQQPYVDADHLFQNLGDGTLSHSGLLAIRASVAAGTNITYKILYNAAVAMTGGQDAVGGYTVPQLTRTLAAEGVHRIYVTTDHPEHYRHVRLPEVATVRDRTRLLAIQDELLGITGTTVLIHDQPCAAELRRKRKRGKAAPPAKRIAINERLCEGCGDCGRKSNCLSVIPVRTDYGRKTQVHQASCNADYTCVTGDCPSFLEVIPGVRRDARRLDPLDDAELPPPRPMFASEGFSMRITGIGGTGVVTLAKVLATAALLDGLAPRGLDQVGLSQKAGPVVSDLKFTSDGVTVSPKVSSARCDLYLGCDILVAAQPDNLAVTTAGHTAAVVSSAAVPTGAMIRAPQTALPAAGPMTAAIDARTRPDANVYLDAQLLAETLFGSDQYANMLLAGAAHQTGALPLDATSIEQAIRLSGVAVENNVQAFRRGRQFMADPAGIRAAVTPAPVLLPAPSPAAAELLVPLTDPGDTELTAVLATRVPDLIAYQDLRYARRYTEVVAAARDAEAAVASGPGFAVAVAINLHKLMAYKDEYEVARLALDPAEKGKIVAQFGDGARVAWKLHPPLLRALGLKNKLSLGRWFTPVYVILRRAKWLRGTKFDIFGYAEVRRTERALVEEYAEVVTDLAANLRPDNHELAIRIAELPDVIRGYEQIKLDNVAAYRMQLDDLCRRFQVAVA